MATSSPAAASTTAAAMTVTHRRLGLQLAHQLCAHQACSSRFELQLIKFCICVETTLRVISTRMLNHLHVCYRVLSECICQIHRFLCSFDAASRAEDAPHCSSRCCCCRISACAHVIRSTHPARLAQLEYVWHQCRPDPAGANHGCAG